MFLVPAAYREAARAAAEQNPLTPTELIVIKVDEALREYDAEILALEEAQADRLRRYHVEQEQRRAVIALVHRPIGSIFPKAVYALPLGAIVGSCRVTASLPIVDNDSQDHAGRFLRIEQRTTGRIELWIYNYGSGRCHDVTDQLPFGDFSPGMHAWILEDATPTTERCPGCWGIGKRVGSCGHCQDRRVIQIGPAPTVNYGHGYSYPCPECSTPEGKAKPCPVCKGNDHCDPIPRTHPGGRLPEWTAT